MGKIHLDIQDHVAWLKIDNPKKLNTLTWSMLEELETHIKEIEARGDMRLAVLSAEPSRAFCAGAAIDEWAALDAQQFSKKWVREGHRIFARLARLSVPTLGLVEAPAFGGGLELLATLDWRIMGETVTLSLPETSIGIIPGWSGTQRVARLLPEPVLRAMVLMGKVLSAKDAENFGFGEVAKNPKARIDELVEAVVKRGPEANRLAKMMINAGVSEDREALIEALGGGMAAASADKAIGVSAFMAKEKPQF